MSNAGWSEYPDHSMGFLMALGAMGAFTYLPNLAPVGSGSAYSPGDTSDDAAALNYLGYYPDPLLQQHVGTSGSAADDMNNATGAWDPTFQTAVTDFQSTTPGLTVDGWIGPKTRTAILAAVTAKNAQPSPIVPVGPYTPPASPIPVPPAVVPPFVPVTPVGPSPLPVQPKPAAAASSDNTLLYAGAAVGVVVVGALAYYLMK